jgi:L-fuconolactonase
MLIDAHVHIWRAVPAYPNPSATIVSPASAVPLDLYLQYMAEFGVERAVLVQPLFPGTDNSYVADSAANEPLKFKAVCVVDSRSPDAAENVQYWAQVRGCAGMRLRPWRADESDLFGDPSTFALWERAQALKLVVSLLMNPAQLQTLNSLAVRFPAVPIVIDHMGHPNVSTGKDSADFKSLLGLARHMNIYVKVSGYYHFSQRPYPYEDCADMFRAIYDAFGANRLFWGSDFPHVLLKVGYRRCLLLQQRFYSYLSDQEMDSIMGGNAARLYWQEGVPLE